MDVGFGAIAALGQLISWAGLVGIGLALRRLVRRWAWAELLLWGYVVMGAAATFPHYGHRAAMDTRNFPGASNPTYYLLAVPPDFVVMALTWPLLEYILLISPVVDPTLRGRLYAEVLSAIVATCLLAPAITFVLRRRDRRSARRKERLDQD
jgi:hypothetical protein